MRILAVSDTESTALWDHYNSNKITNTDLIRCCMCTATMTRNMIRHHRKDASALMIKYMYTRASASSDWVDACPTNRENICIQRKK